MNFWINYNEFNVEKAFRHYKEAQIWNCPQAPLLSNSDRNKLFKQFDEFYIKKYPKNAKLLNKI